MNKVNKESTNVLEENISKLKELFPEVVSEGKIDFDKLKSTLGEFIDSNDEKYLFNWAGKKDTFKNIQSTSKGTFVPQTQESLNFEDTQNIFIEGDNLESLKLLQKSYFEKIKIIYIDPPYNTGKDFIYKDDFHHGIQSYLEQTGQTESGVKLTTNTETSGRFHSDWISFMYARLSLAQNLLRDDGVIFISIDDNEINNLRMIMNEIFGEENFVACIIWQKKYAASNDVKYLSDVHDYLLLYCKRKELWQPNLFPRPKELDAKYSNPDNDPRGPWYSTNLSVKTYSAKLDYIIKSPAGLSFSPPPSRCWAITKEKFQELLKDNRIWFGINGKSRPYLKKFLTEVQEGIVPTTLWLHQDAGHNIGAKSEIRDMFSDTVELFDTPKPTKLIKRIIDMAENKNTKDDIILDFFVGSGTTAQAVLEKNLEDGGNRKFICIQLPEKINTTLAKKSKYKTISDICVERIRRTIKQINEKNKQKPNAKNIPLGFKVFKLAKSNYKIWEDVKDEEKLKDQLKLFEDPLVENYKDIDVIYEVIIKEGYSLNSKIEIFQEKPNKIYKVSDGEFFFYITLDNTLDETVTQSLNLTENTMFVCLDSALDNSQKINLDKICKLRVI